MQIFIVDVGRIGWSCYPSIWAFILKVLTGCWACLRAAPEPEAKQGIQLWGMLTCHFRTFSHSEICRGNPGKFCVSVFISTPLEAQEADFIRQLPPRIKSGQTSENGSSFLTLNFPSLVSSRIRRKNTSLTFYCLLYEVHYQRSLKVGS